MKLHVTSNFSLSHGVFYPHSDKNVVCKVFEFGRVKFVIWEMVNSNGRFSHEPTFCFEKIRLCKCEEVVDPFCVARQPGAITDPATVLEARKKNNRSI